MKGNYLKFSIFGILCAYMFVYVCGDVILYLHFHPVPPFNATITEVTVNNVVTYTCYADGSPNNFYQWIRLRDNEVVSMIQNLTLDNTDPLDGGDYLCTITNIAGNATTMTTHNGEI